MLSLTTAELSPGTLNENYGCLALPVLIYSASHLFTSIGCTTPYGAKDLQLVTRSLQLAAMVG